MNVLIGGAWPYANGSLHIGHIAALLPGDILARYFRAKGYTVMFVSGSDCHGTPVTIRAKQENKTPRKISDFYHNEFNECFERLGFSYDLYGKTSSEEHKHFVLDFHRKLYSGGYVYEKSTPQAYCEKCRQFLPDRFVKGLCPHCGENARGDQCETCGSVLEPENLLQAKCSLCGEAPEFRPSSHLFLAITRMKNELDNYIESHNTWRKNAYEMSKRYVREGLRDRSLTRDLDWGIDVPKDGFAGKKIYIWAENVLGYLSDCYTLCSQQGLDFNEFWNGCKQYYIHGKDNIPFHTIILPSLLLGRTDEGLKLPDEIISSEYLTLEGKKISTSGNWAIWAKDILERYNPDSIRYFLISNGPEKRDTDFTWREFINSHNGELLGAYGNFVNRSLVFIQKSFEGKVPGVQGNSCCKSEQPGCMDEQPGCMDEQPGCMDEQQAKLATSQAKLATSQTQFATSQAIPATSPGIIQSLAGLYSSVGTLIEQGCIKEALDTIFAFVRTANKFFDEEQPWITVKSDIAKCRETLNICVQIIANLSLLLEPFLPFSSEKVRDILKIGKAVWKYIDIPAGFELGPVEILFERIDRNVIREETARLKSQ